MQIPRVFNPLGNDIILHVDQRDCSDNLQFSQRDSEHQRKKDFFTMHGSPFWLLSSVRPPNPQILGLRGIRLKTVSPELLRDPEPSGLPNLFKGFALDRNNHDSGLLYRRDIPDLEKKSCHEERVAGGWKTPAFPFNRGSHLHIQCRQFRPRDIRLSSRDWVPRSLFDRCEELS